MIKDKTLRVCMGVWLHDFIVGTNSDHNLRAVNLSSSGLLCVIFLYSSPSFSLLLSLSLFSQSKTFWSVTQSSAADPCSDLFWPSEIKAFHDLLITAWGVVLHLHRGKTPRLKKSGEKMPIMQKKYFFLVWCSGYFSFISIRVGKLWCTVCGV